MKILFVIPTLGLGGAQKVLADLANDFAEQRSTDGAALHSVSIVTFGTANHATLRSPRREVELIHLEAITGNRTAISGLLKCFHSLRTLVHRLQPEIVISFQDIANYPSIYACFSSRAGLIVSERQDLRFYRFPRLRSALRWLFYRFADSIVVQTESVRGQIESALLPKTTVISNSLTPASFQSRPALRGVSGYKIVAVGRLEKQKNYPLLIEAASVVLKDNELWTLSIFGEGSLRDALKHQINEAGMSGRIFLEGLSTSIDRELAEAHLFVMSSSYEGFPNALAEATAAGLPCIAFNDVSGVVELISDQYNGITLSAENRSALDLANAMARLMNDHLLRGQFGFNGLCNAERYSSQRIFELWQSLLKQVAGSAQR